jgi:arabinogalactan endo-1,4-beta-galactosidase
MLWPDGKLPENWDNFAELVQAGIDGVKAGCDTVGMPAIMIHIDQGGNIARTKYFFDRILEYGIEFDYIGQSYYPWWHGTLLELRANMAFMAEKYRKPIIIVEAAYCASPTEYKTRPGPFPETPEGQEEFLDEVNKIVLQTPGNLGAGIFWWEPATYGGRSSRDFFDTEGNVLPVITVFDKYTRR